MNLVEAHRRLGDLVGAACAETGWHLHPHAWHDDAHSPWVVIGAPVRIDSFRTLGRPSWSFELTVGVDPMSHSDAFTAFLAALDAHDPASLLSRIRDAAETAAWGSFLIEPITTGTEDRGQVEVLTARIPITVTPLETP